ncbi:hypothetical protein PInf_009149 [Phytophthora infestans]|nr:hypothetical protein PInf_009149 [Phytophthora infestans]
MAKSTVYSALDLRDGFYQILMRERAIPLTALAVDGETDVEVHEEHLRQQLGIKRKRKLYANLKKCIFGEQTVGLRAFKAFID